VGYADKTQPMEYEHAGSPVAGGTFPAEIFHDFMTSWVELRQARRLERAANKQAEDGSSTDVAPALPVSPTEVPPSTTTPSEPSTGDTGGGTTGGGGGGQDQAPPQKQQPAEPPPAPAQPETPPPSGGGGGGAAPGGTP
jgi:hypothetical protein